jgi:hypothetical protein
MSQANLIYYRQPRTRQITLYSAIFMSTDHGPTRDLRRLDQRYEALFEAPSSTICTSHRLDELFEPQTTWERYLGQRRDRVRLCAMPRFVWSKAETAIIDRGYRWQGAMASRGFRPQQPTFVSVESTLSKGLRRFDELQTELRISRTRSDLVSPSWYASSARCHMPSIWSRCRSVAPHL